ncbi:uncharacterized protein EV422DRAFT_617315 [Fimicolochytrium jonesii]|uniref:uncharacterized protein n=1 Tax=Fimicolochytrium jonesii TaxID=1396493 RepID=UPI0022FDF62B|nr:uncharacterized protein EV422DRAFT_617315 [Fimicolochytrium jonesii]KAI8824853.1 hypothetical protein EV422DRAFT_617315 [Fimicolochytrium jonesii]
MQRSQSFSRWDTEPRKDGAEAFRGGQVFEGQDLLDAQSGTGADVGVGYAQGSSVRNTSTRPTPRPQDHTSAPLSAGSTTDKQTAIHEEAQRIARLNPDAPEFAPVWGAVGAGTRSTDERVARKESEWGGAPGVQGGWGWQAGNTAPMTTTTAPETQQGLPAKSLNLSSYTIPLKSRPSDEPGLRRSQSEGHMAPAAEGGSQMMLGNQNGNPQRQGYIPTSSPIHDTLVSRVKHLLEHQMRTNLAFAEAVAAEYGRELAMRAESQRRAFTNELNRRAQVSDIVVRRRIMEAKEAITREFEDRQNAAERRGSMGGVGVYAEGNVNPVVVNTLQMRNADLGREVLILRTELDAQRHESQRWQNETMRLQALLEKSGSRQGSVTPSQHQQKEAHAELVELWRENEGLGRANRALLARNEALEALVGGMGSEWRDVAELQCPHQMSATSVQGNPKGRDITRSEQHEVSEDPQLINIEIEDENDEEQAQAEPEPELFTADDGSHAGQSQIQWRSSREAGDGLKGDGAGNDTRQKNPSYNPRSSFTQSEAFTYNATSPPFTPHFSMTSENGNAHKTETTEAGQTSATHPSPSAKSTSSATAAPTKTMYTREMVDSVYASALGFAKNSSSAPGSSAAQEAQNTFFGFA